MMHIHKTEDTSDDGDDPDYHTLGDLSTDSDIESEASSQESVPNIVNSSRSIWPIRSRSWQTKSKLSSSNASISKPMEHTELTVDNINADVASKVIRRFIVLQLAEEGFERAETAALERLQAEVVAFVSQIYARAKAYSEIANRGRPSAPDLLAAVLEHDLDVPSLLEVHKANVKRSKRRKANGEPEPTLNIEFVLPEPKEEDPELLDSDDEEAPSDIPESLRSLPDYLPPLPPKHTYLRTPVPPPKKQALPSLEKKLENAALVQDSLKSLLLATEVDADANDGELFGGVVNWEATRYPRKKWKLSCD